MSAGVTRVVLDRWEGEHGVLEGLGPVPRALLPSGLKEGDVLSVKVTGRSVTLEIDDDARSKLEQEIQELRDGLVKADDSKGGDIDL